MLKLITKDKILLRGLDPNAYLTLMKQVINYTSKIAGHLMINDLQLKTVLHTNSRTIKQWLIVG